MKKISLLALCLSVTVCLSAAGEHRHFITTEAGIGYSSIFHSSDLGTSAGLVGGALQVGYEWNWRQLLVHTGLEFASINNIAQIHPFELTTPYSIGLPAGVAMTEHFSFYDYTESQRMGQINIPVMVGGLFDERYYFLAGIKVGLPVYQQVSADYAVKTTLSDPTLEGQLGEYEDVLAHHAYTSQESLRQSIASAVNIQASAEVGVSISSFLPKKKKGRSSSPARGKKQPLPYYYRVGLFCDYGITSCVQAPAAPVDVLASVSAPRDIVGHSYMETEGRFSSFLVGVKFAMLFQVNRPKPAVKPQSWLTVEIADAETEKLIGGRLRIEDQKTGKVQTREVKKGKVRSRSKVGTFDVTATATDYYADTQSYTIAELGEDAQLYFALRHRPYFRFRVTNGETGEPLAVSAALINRATKDTVLRLSSTESGEYVSRMLEDTVAYGIHIAQLGYEPYAADIASISDSMDIVLVPIRQGETIVLHHLYFATNETRILPASEGALDDLYTFLDENPKLRIRIVGHTDNVGTDQANMVLSEGRAEAVKAALVARGLAAERIETAGMGMRQPVASNDTEEGRAQNRRVEFEVVE